MLQIKALKRLIGDALADCWHLLAAVVSLSLLALQILAAPPVTAETKESGGLSLKVESNDAVNNIRRFSQEPPDTSRIPQLVRDIAMLIVNNDLDPEQLNLAIIEYVMFLEQYDDGDGNEEEQEA